jgi:hypothetical protein
MFTASMAGFIAVVSKLVKIISKSMEKSLAWNLQFFGSEVFMEPEPMRQTECIGY